ncbi:hypothetical protein [Capnocytophaga leadbetteri]|jgi:hypothetical protein|uniref:hypothetical protein n=1 Tax=Capnocytophaga leadbetteri TaxID=327575 RepID=UPI0026EC89C5|nr:hypothetical protein [Capnocytophaga leadbetteri]
MELIVLKGKAHSGKTATINYVYNELKDKRKYSQHRYQKFKKGDFLAVIKKGNETIGFISQGEGVSYIKRFLKEFKNQDKCTKVICAQRENLGTKTDPFKGYSISTTIIIQEIAEINQKVDDILASL